MEQSSAPDSTPAPGTCGSEEAPGALGMGRRKHFGGGHLSFLGSSSRWSPTLPSPLLSDKDALSAGLGGEEVGQPIQGMSQFQGKSVNASGANRPERRLALGGGLRGTVHPG